VSDLGEPMARRDLGDPDDRAGEPEDGGTVYRIDVASAITANRLRDQSRAAMVAALPPDLVDDRFDQPPPEGTMAATEVRNGAPTGLVTGQVDAGELVLDALLVVTPDEPTAQIDRRARRLWGELAGLVPPDAVSATVWGRPALAWHERLAAELGFEPSRKLHQLRAPLASPATLDGAVGTLSDRAFRPGQDEAALIDVNNRAFADHPDQGGMTPLSLAETMSLAWFDPEGLRVLDDPARPGRLAGFCWTKVHPPSDDRRPALGEIYVIGLDPDHHGKGLGAPMTAAGLRWLARAGLTTALLYVEADNHPALATYARLGFSIHRTDRAWRGPLGAGPERQRGPLGADPDRQHGRLRAGPATHGPLGADRCEKSDRS
jgi:mycothiol synthase